RHTRLQGDWSSDVCSSDLGARTGTLSLTDNAGGSPQIMTLSGNGTAPGVGLAPTSLDFGNQLLATTSAPMTVTLTNTGAAALTRSEERRVGKECRARGEGD